MKILIVEDDELNRKLFKTLLQGANYEVIEAENGEDAVRMAKENIPDLILMDIQMPVMDGITATKILKSDPSTLKMPVIAVTAYAMEGDEEGFLVEGFNGYISKPIDINAFIETVKKYVEQ